MINEKINYRTILRGKKGTALIITYEVPLLPGH